MGKKVLVPLVCLLLGFFAAGQEQVLTVVATTDPPHLDPAVVTDYEAGMVTYNMYETLLVYDPKDFSIKPCLAESWEISKDGRSAIFHLRKGVKFHDGTPFNAEAVKFSLERTQALDRAPATYLRMINKVEILGEYTVKFYSSEPWAFWEDALATRKALSIVSPSYVKAHATADDPWAAEWMHEHACGTGPYMLAEWVHGQYVKLVKFPDYWRGWDGKHFDTVFIRTVREPSVEELMTKTGQADIAYDIPETHLPVLAEDPNVVVQLVPGMAQLFFPMQCHKGPLADIRVRKAVTYGIDMDQVVAVYPGAVRAQGAIPRSMLGADPTAPIYPYDPEVARLLLKDAGYEPGKLTLRLVYVAGVEWERRAALVVQQNLAEIGVNVKIEAMPWSTLFPLLADPDQSPEMYIFYSAARFADPHGILWETFHSGALGPAGFNNGYSNPEFDRLLDEAERTIDREARAELYRKANRILIQDVPAVFVWEMPYPFVYRADLKNVEPDELFRTYYYYDLYRE